MDVIKKRWLSILCGVVALIAVGVYATWNAAQRTKLQQQLAQRKQTYDQLQTVLNKPRHLPIVSLTADAPAEELKHFPSQRIIEAGKAAVKQVQDQSLAVKNEAVAMNKHQLLVEGSLPSPVDAFAFVRAYNEKFNPKNAKSIPAMLNAATPPTDDEVKSRQAKLEQDMLAKAPRNAEGEIYQREQLDQQIREAQDRLPEVMKTEAATQHKIYVAPDALSQHPDLAAGSGMTPDATKIWYAQVMLWVEQDIAAAISDVNKSSHNVDQSPVKQLVGLAIPSNDSMYAIPSAAANTGSSATPAATPTSNVPANADTDPLPKDFTISPTGRACNGVFDVVQFTVILKVNSADIGRVINELERGRLITVYQTDVQSVNSAADAQEGYLLGSNPVALITLKCEELFLRDWSKPLMPPEIQSLLNASPQPAAPAQPTASTN
jgi:hypothetical protein